MSNYEYKVVPAPKKGLKGRGIKGAEARFAHALMTVMNELGAEGWEYQRSDTLPCQERTGLRGRSTTFQNMLVFRREVHVAAEAVTTNVLEPAAVATPAVAAETIAKTHAPLRNGAVGAANNTAPAIGSALGPVTNEAVEVKGPRAGVAPQ